MLKEIKRFDLKSFKDEDGAYYSKMVQSEDGAWVRFSDCEKAVKDLTLAMSHIKIHFEHLCSEEMRVHGYVSHEHSIDFQVFRVLCGYQEALDELALYKESANGG